MAVEVSQPPECAAYQAGARFSAMREPTTR
jgi:hypothetical protein